MLDLPFFDDHHRALADRVRLFARDRIAPHAIEADAGDTNRAARAFVRSLGESGVLQLVVPDRSRSSAPPDLRSICLAREALAAQSAVADSVFAVQGLGCHPIWLAGSDVVQERYLQAAGHGSIIAAFALTEQGAGSDANGMETTASADGSDFVLSGTKTLISNAGIADVFVVFAQERATRAEADVRTRKSIGAFVVDADNPGLRVVRDIALLAPHPIGEIALESCRVPASHRLGGPGDGWKLALATLDFFRSSVGAAACGAAYRALAEAQAHVGGRRQFGRALSEFQGTRFALADMQADLDAARLLVYRAAWLKDHGRARITREASIAKLYATEAAQRIVDRALQLHGGAGLVKGSPIERLYREVRALRIYEGTSEIQRLIIAQQMLGAAEADR